MDKGPITLRDKFGIAISLEAYKLESIGSRLLAPIGGLWGASTVWLDGISLKLSRRG
ncbi:MAG TPA: hypothetical protein VLZ74_15945 [Methylocella sp.]|nr:hypothetical protein [Methylocella sp.]